VRFYDLSLGNSARHFDSAGLVGILAFRQQTQRPARRMNVGKTGQGARQLPCFENLSALFTAFVLVARVSLTALLAFPAECFF
jgi:hypothetical protein